SWRLSPSSERGRTRERVRAGFCARQTRRSATGDAEEDEDDGRRSWRLCSCGSAHLGSVEVDRGSQDNAGLVPTVSGRVVSQCGVYGGWRISTRCQRRVAAMAAATERRSSPLTDSTIADQSEGTEVGSMAPAIPPAMDATESLSPPTFVAARIA